MDEQTLRELQQMRSYPSLSIFLPTYFRSADDLQQNPTRLKKLIRQAIDKLLTEFSRSQVKDLLTNLDKITDEIDFAHPRKGLAIFVNNSVGKSFPLSFAIDERIVIDEAFVTRYLVHAQNRSKRYLLLLLTRNVFRLYDCQRDVMQEIEQHGFPYTIQDSDQTDAEYHGSRHGREFLNHIDDAVETVASKLDLPIVIAGVERNLADFRDASKQTNRIIATIEGSYEKTPLPELSAIAWAAARQGFEEKRLAVLDQLDNAVGAQQFASGVDNVWRAAQEGRVATLLVDEDFRYPAAISTDGMSLTEADSNHGTIKRTDAVDEIIDAVMQKKGQVVFQEKGTLDKHQRIAAITRF